MEVKQTIKTRFKDESTQGQRGGMLYHKHDSLFDTDIVMSYIGLICIYMASENDIPYIM